MSESHILQKGSMKNSGSLISVHGQTLVRRSTNDQLEGFLAGIGKNGPVPRMRKKIVMGSDFTPNQNALGGSGRSSRISSQVEEPTYFDRLRLNERSNRKNGRLALISDFGRKSTKADIFGNPITSTRTKFGRPHQEAHMIPARRGPENRQPW